MTALSFKDLEIERLRSLLGRYAHHVEECGGSDFLSEFYLKSDSAITPAEAEEILDHRSEIVETLSIETLTGLCRDFLDAKSPDLGRRKVYLKNWLTGQNLNRVREIADLRIRIALRDHLAAYPENTFFVSSRQADKAHLQHKRTMVVEGNATLDTSWVEELIVDKAKGERKCHTGGPVSGRWSSKLPNLSMIPRDGPEVISPKGRMVWPSLWPEEYRKTDAEVPSLKTKRVPIQIDADCSAVRTGRVNAHMRTNFVRLALSHRLPGVDPTGNFQDNVDAEGCGPAIAAAVYA